MSHEYGNLFEWGLCDGEIVHVSSVPNGLKCNCLCPACETPLVAFNNPANKRASHFRHQRIVNCSAAFESALHYLAKQVILETKTLLVPDIRYILEGWAGFYTTPDLYIAKAKINGQKLEFDKVEMERNANDFRPDLIVYIKEKPFYIEIAVTHFVDTEKMDRVKKHAIPLLEIDLSDFDRNIQRKKLIDILKGDISYMRWLFNPKAGQRQVEANEVGAKIRSFVLKHAQSHKVYGKKELIYDCPLFSQTKKEIQVQEFCLRCNCFSDMYEGVYALGSEQPKYPDITLECVGHVKSEFESLLKFYKIETKSLD